MPEISTKYCASLVKSMPSRLAVIVREKGGHTKYYKQLFLRKK